MTDNVTPLRPPQSLDLTLGQSRGPPQFGFGCTTMTSAPGQTGSISGGYVIVANVGSFHASANSSSSTSKRL